MTWPAIAFDGTGYMNADVDSTNWAIYGDTTYELSDNVSLIAGLRYTNDELSYDYDRPTGPIIIPNIPPNIHPILINILFIYISFIYLKTFCSLDSCQ